jgi:hypothetical protein
MKLSTRTAQLADALQQALTEPYPPRPTPARKRARKPKQDGGGER